MKLFKKITSIITVFIALCLAAVGCGPKENPQTEYDISIMLWRSGIGQEFLNKAITGFEKEYPQYRVWLDISSTENDLQNTLGKGKDIDKVDLWVYSLGLISENSLMANAEPLNDILDSTYKDEGVTLGSKFESNALNYMRSPDGNFYRLTYGGGYVGIVYNPSVIDGVKYKVPRTTQEMEDLVLNMSYDSDLDNMSIFIHHVNGGYWREIMKVWQAQYDGLDYYLNTFMALDDGESDAPSKDILLAEDGRKATIEAMERIFKPSYIYPGSNSMEYTDAQTLFMQDKAIMSPNGSWLVNEMKSDPTANQNLLMMKPPVISSIIDKCTTILDDSQLSALIDAVDSASDKASVPLSGEGYNVSRSDADRIYEARNILGCVYDVHGMVIPKYAVAKEGAIEFLKYFYSDENLSEYWGSTHMSLPIKYSNGNGPDTSDWNEWEKQQQDFTNDCIPLYSRQINQSPLFTVGGANPYANLGVVTKFTVQNAADRMDAKKCWDYIVNYHNTNWTTYLTNAQL